ncbi:sugar phosphate nucleotidyltransferase [Paraconexibacter algicola]|uniref:Nucleoside-diphosphate-sugar pyrophosphorylase n=1 Tax=Paraconexibacter algicola TaxID=2133960 RepID=A0A2T4UGY8_9ACTN|nr:sugar phosphate nucleotidyltransferase [Paraconexibacter algicola]PTL58469.1 nucleoside-diphosphate-sugar pyrophosphorylase [Paraconexibacter algicola]
MSRRAIILAGGLGTRLRPYTVTLPKPLMPVGDRPILDIVLRQLRHHGFEHVTIATGHLAELIEAYCRNGESYGLRIDYFREEEPLGTVGALALIDGLRDEPFLVMNGDVLTDLDYAALLARHEASDAVATIATRVSTVEVSLGVLHFDAADDTRLADYSEKPTHRYESSMGVYCFSPKAIEYIEPGVRLDFPDHMLRLVAAGEVVRGWRSEDFWLDIGRPGDYEQAQEDYERLVDRLLPGGA